MLKTRFGWGIRLVAVILHSIVGGCAIFILHPLMRLTTQESHVLVLVVVPLASLVTVFVTAYREMTVRRMGKFLDGYAANEATAADFEACFTTIINLPRAEVILGALLWAVLAFPIMIALYLSSDTFVGSSFVYISFTVICMGLFGATIIFGAMKKLLKPYLSIAASGIPDPERRSELVKRIPVGFKLSVSVASLMGALTFVGIAYSQTQILTTVEAYATKSHSLLLERISGDVGMAVQEGSIQLQPQALVLDLGTAQLLVVDRVTGEIVSGDPEAILPGEIRAVLDSKKSSGNSSIFSSPNTFSWTPLPDEKHVLFSVSPGASIGIQSGAQTLYPVLLALFGIIVVIFAARFQTDDLTQSIGILRNQLAKVAAGDLRPDEILESEDDIGELARSVDEMRTSLQTTVTDMVMIADRVDGAAASIAEASSGVAESSIDQGESIHQVASSMEHINANAGTIQEATDALDQSLDQTSGTMEDMASTAETLGKSGYVLSTKVQDSATASQTLLQSIGRVVQGSDVLVTSNEGTVSGLEEMAAALREVDSNAAETTHRSEEVVTSAKHGHVKVRETIEGITSIRSDTELANEIVRDLGSQTDEIGSIASVITNVADETNLLALNAAIIAAQAGEHGRAFSVVADEIKGLAERVLASTKEIVKVIEGVQGGANRAVDAIERITQSVGEGVTLSEEAGSALEAITMAARESGDRMHEIVAAVAQQSAAATHVVGLMAEMSDAVEEIKLASHEQTDSTGEVTEGNEAMKEASSRVHQATEEQNRSAIEIGDSVETLRKVAVEIMGAVRAQSQAVVAVADLMEAVKERTKANEISTEKMGDSVETLQAEASRLRDGVQRFKV